MRITNNIMALNTYNHLNRVASDKNQVMEKLASGLRINRAGDDAAGLSISEKMRGQIKGLQMAEKNSMDGISLIQTAEGALQENHSILQRMRELTVQAGNDTNTVTDRDNISREISRLVDELDKILTQTQFNTKNLFLGLDTDAITFQVGANATETIDLFIKKSVIPSFGYFVWEAGPLIIGGPGADRIIDVSDNAKASQFLSALDKGITDVSQERSNLGAMQNRLEHTLANLQTYSENLTAAESRTRDTDMALAMVTFTKKQIIENSATAMLAQANQAPQLVLQLLK